MATSTLETSLVYDTDEVRQHVCDLCIQGNEKNDATAFCTLCMQYLCALCHKSHSRANVSKNHKVLTGKDMPADKDTAKQRTPVCDKHQESALDTICYDHKTACCAKCKILHHRFCKRVTEISNLSQEGVKEDNLLKLESLCCLLNEFARLETVADTFKSDLQSQRTNIVKEIDRERQKIVDTLDRLEKDLISTLDKESFEDITHLEKHKDYVSCFKDELAKQVNDYDNILKTGAAHEVILASISMESEAQKYNSVVQEVYDSLQSTYIAFSINRKIKIMRGLIKKFGKLEIKRSKADNRRRYVDRQAVYLKEINYNSPSDKTQGVILKGIEVLPNGNIVVCDTMNLKVKLLNGNGEILSFVKLSSYPYAMALMAARYIMVSLPGENCLQSIYIEENDKLVFNKKIPTSQNYCKLVKYREHCIAGGVRKDGNYYLDIIGVRGRVHRRILVEPTERDVLIDSTVMCLNAEDSILCVDAGDGCVGLSLEDEALQSVFRFEDESLENSSAICAVPDGCMLVSGLESRNIVMIRTDGTRVRELLKLKNNMIQLITYNREQNLLLVKLAFDPILKVFSLI